MWVYANICVILGERVPRAQVFKCQIEKKIKHPLFNIYPEHKNHEGNHKGKISERIKSQKNSNFFWLNMSRKLMNKNLGSKEYLQKF